MPLVPGPPPYDRGVPRRIGPTVVVAATYAVALALVGLWPQTVDDDIDVTAWPPVRWMTSAFGLTTVQGYDVVQFVANVAMFVPLGVLALVVRRRTTLVQATVAGAGVSVLIELLQHWLRPERVASPQDVVANALGAALGAGAVLLWTRRSRA